VGKINGLINLGLLVEVIWRTNQYVSKSIRKIHLKM